MSYFKIYSNPATFYRFFRLYLFMAKFGYYQSERSEVYDHLGAIDTLGSRSERTRFTSSYSDEMVSSYFIHLPFNVRIALYNGDGKEVYIERGK